MNENNFAADVDFLRQHVETLVLKNKEGAGLAVVPQYQGRTMTSTAAVDSGQSHGFINYDAVASPTLSDKINLYGGEERLWISPEGGQFSIFFEPHVEMSFDNWRTPPELDTVGFELQQQTDSTASFSQVAKLTNWTGTQFDVSIERVVELLDSQFAAQRLGTSLDGLSVCIHQSRNTLTNAGDRPWTQASGLISIWMLCMSKPSDTATLMVPFANAKDQSLDSVSDDEIVTADYFGQLGSDRLRIDRDAGLIYFLGDGKHRSKLGLGFGRATDRLGSWDAQRGVLSVVEYRLPGQAPDGYCNNLWEMQEYPFAGDVLNCYNDGQNESGKNLAEGGFFELESLSPALALEPGQSYEHLHRTIRLEGNREQLDNVAKQVFGVGLATIESQVG
jgi:hypothetical protein